jgi:hypothetical protein
MDNYPGSEAERRRNTMGRNVSPHQQPDDAARSAKGDLAVRSGIAE